MTNTADCFLKGRVAIVTGGITGIGKAIGQALTKAGAKVAVGSRTAHMHAVQINADGIDLALSLDVTSDDSVRAFCGQVATTLGPIDILVNAAGIMPDHPLEDHPDDLWEKTIDVNLNGTYRTIKHCLPGMKFREWGRIINIASTAAAAGSVGFSAYSASKAGVLGLTRCVALEGAASGVTCNAISPGWVETDMALDWLKAQATKENRPWKDYLHETKQQANPQQRMIQPQEIAALTVFLCRNEAKAITMEDLRVSAGALW
uniref:NAD(P)-dependent dehydrogenase, short-chain alcohol dehydrogenase family n=1 Tax=Candidatus Kentrum sp. LPFa TaxID=2126335 RepID=A0A450VPS8_9GAMM|nr:MAG: NAD(P)-dependent dehydrogenase, short-chain alcohol dehydrogenase family [Candidatus Kentron sp. LPFa]VFK23446.1 MAG: NAD(P)-dependent dehydrogenase, short-chain alcohol dehydrogenase family [Candidatus Kentron sp. LPFa]